MPDINVNHFDETGVMMSDDFDDPYDDYPQRRRRSRSRERKKSRTGLWIGLGIGGGALCMLVCFGACFVFYQFGTDVFSEEVRVIMRDNPVIQEQIGTINTFELDMARTGAAPGPEDYVFRIEGSKGSGYVTCECITNDLGNEEVHSGELELDSGEVLDLFPGAMQLPTFRPFE